MSIPEVSEALQMVSLEDPMDLQQWFTHWLDLYPASDLIYKRVGENQIMSLRDRLPRLAVGYDAQYPAQTEVVGYHVSKSVPLPVVAFRPTSGLQFILRDNFHDWNVSVMSDRTLRLDPTWGTPPLDHTNGGWFQGFPRGTQFGPYASSDKKHFSAAIYDWDRLIVFLVDCMRAYLSAEPSLRK